MKRRTTWISFAAACLFVFPAAFLSGPVTVVGQDAVAMNGAKVGLDGYCAVCVTKMKKWEKGSPDFASRFDGATYYFPNAEIKGKFDASPAQFAPILNGDCIVCYAKMGKRVPGKVQHSSLYKGRLYLFPSEKEKQMFGENAEQFANSDLALNGECAVCLAKMGKHVPGSEQFTVVHNGLRYQFPSAKEADMFRQSPAQFVQSGAGENHTGMTTPVGAVRLVGRGGCAGCEHGIKPLSAPNELGLAINTKDGRIIVVEDAHKLYPREYKARFDGGQMEVEGKIVKTSGKVSWLQPSMLRMVN